MRAVVIEKPGSFEVGELPDPAPGPGQVVVAPRAVGVCGTDVHIMDGEFPPTTYPIVPGHEFAGEVVEVGAGVDRALMSQRVAVDPSLFCGHCVYCLRQRGNLCANWGAIGNTVNGGFADYVVVPARNAYRLSDTATFSAGALVEPMSCAVHGLRRLAMPPGSNLLVVGGGTMGLLLFQLARRTGAASVAVVDTDPARVAIARRLGADGAFDSVDAALEAEADGYDYVVEASGSPAAGRAALRAVRRGGTFMVFGVAPADARLEISPFEIYNSEINIIGSMAVLYTFEPALRLLDAGAVDTETMVSHRFPLQSFGQALEAVRERRGVKVQLEPEGRGASAS